MNSVKQNLELDFTKITALENQNLEIFSSSFVVDKAGYSQEILGSLFGIIQVLDHSKESEYLPNLLINVIKKKFYTQNSKDSGRNFEKALKKANETLAELAEHDITNWGENLNAIICLTKDDNLYFAQAGHASIFLQRNGRISDLSNPNPPINIHPVKTFQDVVVGNILPDDKIIISTPDIKNIFSLTELNNLTQTFNSTEFDTALTETLKKEARNNLTIIVNVSDSLDNEKTRDETILSSEEILKNKNFLGADITDINKEETEEEEGKIPEEKKNAKEKKETTTPEKKDKEIAKKKKEDKEKTDKTDEKETGSEIPVTKKNPSLASPPPQKTKIPSKNKKSNKSSWEVENVLLKRPPKKLNDLKIEEDSPKEKKSPFEESPEIFISADEDISIQKKKKSFIKKNKLENFFRGIKPNKQNDLTTDTNNQQKNTTLSNFFVSGNKIIQLTIVKCKAFGRKLSSNYLPKIITGVKNIFKHEKFKNFISHFSTWLKKIKWPNERQRKRLLFLVKKHYLKILFLLLLVLIPLLFAKFSSPAKEEKKEEVPVKTETSLQKKPTPTPPKKITSAKQFVDLDKKIRKVAGSQDFLIILTTDNSLIQVNKKTKEVSTINPEKKITLRNIKNISYLDNLDLFILNNDKEIISYSPKTKKFHPNKIEFPTNFNSSLQESFLDYLYILDATSKQIYRYPRATGGFGSPKKWLKENLTETASLVGMIISGNIKLIHRDGTVDIYNRGIKEKSTKIKTGSIKMIVSEMALDNYYLLANENGKTKIIQVDKDNNRIIKKREDIILSKITSFLVDEKLKKIYLFKDNEILTLNL